MAAEIGPVPFVEAIEWARKRKVVLPTVYYGLLQGRARAAAFSIAGVSAMSQLHAVLGSLQKAIDAGESMDRWKARVAAGEVPLELPGYRLDTIFRTNIQSWYSAGRCRQIADHKDTRPYLMYSAVNDSRTRPTHAQMDGFIAKQDDPVWQTWMTPAGYNCRCTVISLTEAQAKKRGFKPFPGVSPDPGWNYSVCSDGPEEGIRRAIKNRLDGAMDDPSLRAGTTAWRRALRDYLDTVESYGDRERLLIDTMGTKAFSRHAKAVEKAAAAHDITLPQAVMLRAYTDRGHYFGVNGDIVELNVALNTLSRLMAHPEMPMGIPEGQLYRLGIMTLILDEAIEAMPPTRGAFWRGVDVQAMPAPLRQRWLDAHRKGRVVQYNGYTSIMGQEGRQYPGDWQMMFFVESARDLRDFSVAGEPELVIPRGVKYKYVGFVNEYPGYRVMREVGMEDKEKTVKKERQFEISEDLVQEFIADGWSREAAIDVLQKGKQAIKEWAEEREKPIDPKRLEAQKAIFRRMQNEIVAGYKEE